MKNRKIRMGMIGGGSDAFIGAIHRRAALMENEIELVCGCFSINPEISLSSGRSYYLPDERIYSTWQEMIAAEALLPEGERMDFVTIVTPIDSTSSQPLPLWRRALMLWSISL